MDLAKITALRVKRQRQLSRIRERNLIILSFFPAVLVGAHILFALLT